MGQIAVEFELDKRKWTDSFEGQLIDIKATYKIGVQKAVEVKASIDLDCREYE